MQPNVIQPNQPQTPVTAPVAQDVSRAPQPQVSPEVAQFAQAYQAPRGSERSFVKVAATAAAFVIVFVAGYGVSSTVNNMSQKNATKQAQAFVAALNKGDSTQAYSLASKELRSQQTEQQFASSLGDLTASSPTVTDQSTAFNGRDAMYSVTEDGLPATDTGATTGTFAVALIKSGLVGWKVDSVQVN